MTADTELKQYAVQIAESLKSQEASFEREILDLETQLAQARASRDAARGAVKRLADFQVQIRGNYQCPRCWIEHGIQSNLRSVPSTTYDDIFRCRECGSDFDVKF